MVFAALALVVIALLLLTNLGSRLFQEQPAITLAQTNSYLVLGSFVALVASMSLVGLMRSPLFIASLIRTAIWLPGTTAVATIAMYLIFSGPTGDGTVGINAVIYGVPIGIAAWALYAYASPYFSTARGANPQSYAELVARVSPLAHRANADPEAIKGICNMLSSGDPRWVQAAGYIQAWEALHGEEQRLLEVEANDSPTLITTALDDRQRLVGAQMSDSDALRGGLTMALASLSPGLVPYLGVSSTTAPPPAGAITPADAAGAARMVICSTHKAIEAFRHDRWERVVRARNHLIAAAALTGLVAYLGLAIALVSSITPDMLRFAAAYYIVGAGVGLLAQLKISGSHLTAVEDYGLTAARLVQTPLLSGLAGLGGVLFAAATGHLVSSSTIGAPGDLLGSFFSASGLLGGILTSAIFGASPALFLNSLQEEANTYKSQLASTETSDSGSGSAS